MAGKRGMADAELEENLKFTKYVRIIKGYFEKEDKDHTKEIKSEFKRRKTSAYSSDTVDGGITTSESDTLNERKLLKNYTIDELYKMGAFKFDAKRFKEKSKLPEEDIKKYVSKKPGKKQLNITLKPELSEESIETIEDIFQTVMGKLKY